MFVPIYNRCIDYLSSRYVGKRHEILLIYAGGANTMKKIINELRYFNKKFPEETLIEVIKMKDEIIPILLEELDSIIDCPEIITKDKDYMLHIYAIYLLAQFREKRAFTKLIDLISFEPEEVDLFLGDVLTESLSSILYSTFDGNLSILQNAIENPLLNIYARGACLDVFGKLYSDELISKKECIGYLRKLIYNGRNFDLATDIEGVVIDRHIFDMIDDIEFLYEENHIDPSMFGKYDDFIDLIYLYEEEKDRVEYIENIIDEMHWWASFEQSQEVKIKYENQMKKLEELVLKEDKNRGKMNDKPRKIGRNDPCLCGSEKKYKRCCMGKETTVKAEHKEGSSESLEEQKKWLGYYPKESGERKDGQVVISAIYDKEAIKIDKLVYLALHYRAIPIWVKRDKFKEEMIMISYLIKAYENFLLKCEKEEITSFDEYDSKHKIHYKSREWIKKLKELIIRNDLEYDYEDYFERINKTIYEFS